jgi:Phosphatidylserine/phosphatidylglycerophosphate/cardiolipin synthases and related enzymes
MPAELKKQHERKAPHLKRVRKLLNNPVVKSLIYGRVVLIFILLLLQLLLFLTFSIWLEPYTKYMFGSGMAVSFLFLVYLFNREGKNEYKMAWMLPVFFFPLFGIGLYVLMHVEDLPHKLKKQIRALGKKTEHITSLPDFTDPSVPYPEIRDIAVYLRNEALAPAYTNSNVEYFPNGETAFPEMIASLKRAKKFIFIEYFIINAGVMWDAMLNILVQKAAEGVEIRVMYDALGSITISPAAYEKYLTSLGIQAKAFIPLAPVVAAYLNNRDHRKICVVDGECAFTGGINLSDEYINRMRKKPYYWKDTVVRVTGRAVRSFSSMFLQLWNLVTYTSDNFDTYINIPYRTYDVPGVVIPYGDYAYNKKDIAENVYCYILSQAKKYVHITTPYVILDNQMLNALSFAVSRGVEVSMLVPKHFDHYITQCTGRVFIRTLNGKGVRVYEYTPGFIHAKMFIADDTTAVVGSINLDYRSLYNQFEDAVFMYKCPVVRDIEKDFEDTKAQCTEITAETYKKSPVIRRIVGRVFRLCAPLL